MLSSKQQTKDWRKAQYWYKGCKSNECEKHQIIGLKDNVELFKNKDGLNGTTNIRINLEKMDLEEIKTPLNNDNGFEYTEDFDGHIKDGDRDIYINLKMTIELGGAQTRTMREVYHFIKGQIEILKKKEKCVFINILDGDQSYKHKDKFEYLIKKSKLTIDQQKRIYIGDSKTFVDKYKNYI